VQLSCTWLQYDVMRPLTRSRSPTSGTFAVSGVGKVDSPAVGRARVSVPFANTQQRVRTVAVALLRPKQARHTPGSVVHCVRDGSADLARQACKTQRGAPVNCTYFFATITPTTYPTTSARRATRPRWRCAPAARLRGKDWARRQARADRRTEEAVKGLQRQQLAGEEQRVRVEDLLAQQRQRAVHARARGAHTRTVPSAARGKSLTWEQRS